MSELTPASSIDATTDAASDSAWAFPEIVERVPGNRDRESADDPAVDDPLVTEAKWVVAEYLRDVGLRDPELIARESQRIVEKARRERIEPALPSPTLAEVAIRCTVSQLDEWLLALAAESQQELLAESARGGRGARVGGVAGARLRDLLSRYPEAWKRSQPSAEAVETSRRELVTVVPEPKPRRMRRQRLTLIPQSLNRLRRRIGAFLTGTELPRESGPGTAQSLSPAPLSRHATTRDVLAVLTSLSTLLGTWVYCHSLSADGFGLIDAVLGMLFAVLFVWVAFSFWMATLGAVVILRRGKEDSSSQGEGVPAMDLPPTAVVMPIYNEDPDKVFANLQAIAESLQLTGKAADFSLYALSDTTEPEVWLEEERAWARLVAKLPADCRVFYRHRPKNVSRKAGNIADFCSRWGAHYKYMIVLDADSVMAGATLVEMVRRMERDPRIGILQAPPRPVNRQSVFARMQQFSAYLYGPVFLEGFVQWSQCDGNYWGHNAIIRVRPFMQHCELPVLPGEGPLSGEILSHDFVEAALMRRAGWKVCIAHDLQGSYEECPTTILDFAQRDQRWCQGNMQHIRLLLAEGLHPASRLHFGMGAMSYLASPLWLAFLLLTIAGAVAGSNRPADGSGAPGGAALFGITMGMLLLPKLWSAIALSRRTDRPVDSASGTRLRAWRSALLEMVLSMLIAPIMMLLHTRFVVSTLLGTKVKWSAQQRDDRGVSLASAFAVHYPHTLAGLAIGGIVWAWAPDLLPWLLPVLAGLVSSIPLAMLLGSVSAGNALARRGLLTIPEDIDAPPVLQSQREALSRGAAGAPSGTAATAEAIDVFEAVLRDPAFYALHVGILRATESHVPLADEQREQVQSVFEGRCESIAPEIRRVVLGDSRILEALHLHVRSHLPATQSVLA